MHFTISYLSVGHPDINHVNVQKMLSSIKKVDKLLNLSSEISVVIKRMNVTEIGLQCKRK